MDPYELDSRVTGAEAGLENCAVVVVNDAVSVQVDGCVVGWIAALTAGGATESGEIETIDEAGSIDICEDGIGLAGVTDAVGIEVRLVGVRLPNAVVVAVVDAVTVRIGCAVALALAHDREVTDLHSAEAAHEHLAGARQRLEEERASLPTLAPAGGGELGNCSSVIGEQGD